MRSKPTRPVLPELADAVASYLDLLNDPLGISATPPLGYTIFRERQPERSLEAATVLDRSGSLVPVVDTEGEPVIGGHKDLVLLLDLVGDYGCNAATLAGLYSLAGQDDDARATVSDAQRFVYIQGAMLKELAGSEGPPRATSPRRSPAGSRRSPISKRWPNRSGAH